MATEQDTLARMASGPQWAAQDLVPPVPVFSTLCPRLAKIAPDEARKMDEAWKKWTADFVVRLTRGSNSP